MDKINFQLNCSGTGLWSNCQKCVSITQVGLNYISERENFGELVAVFDKQSWNIAEDGLIYTDPQWMEEFRVAMKEKFNLSEQAVQDIDYSEQGMQGSNYVSMDVQEKFLQEWCKEITN